jgi:hypothetical protein
VLSLVDIYIVPEILTILKFFGHLKIKCYNNIVKIWDISMEKMPNELKKYQQLIDEAFFDEAFQVLKNDVSNIKDTIEQKRIIRLAFSIPLQEKQLMGLASKNQLGDLVHAMNKALEEPFFEDMKSRLSTIVNNREASKIVAVCMLEGKLDAAKTFVPYAIKDASVYDETIDTLVVNNNVEGLRFLCENFDNIHFNSDELLAKATNMKPEALRMLIDEFDFDMNVQTRLESNLILNIIAENNIKNFDWLNKNYPSKINYSQDMIYQMIEKEDNVDFYSTMLSNQNLKQVHLEKIGNFLFNPKSVEKYSQTDIYEKFFAHKNFDDQAFTLGQGYFIYGLLSKIGTASKRESNDSVRNYVRVLNTYMNTLESDIVPDSPDFHIVGAAVHVAKVGNTQSTNDACVAVMRRFPRYINKPNPSGMLPIQQVEKDSFLYQMLVNNGAVSPEPEPTFWGSVLNVFKGKKEKKEVIVEQESPQQKQETTPQSSIGVIRIKMRNDFRTMREYLADELCDPSIKMKCENMFLKADKLSMVMEKNNLSSFNDELHFLSENFSNYLKKSLKAYIDLAHATHDLDEDQVKTNKAKKLCMEHVNLLTEQLDLITNNISNGLTDNAMMELKTRGKFLEDRFNQSLKDEDIDTDLNSENNPDDNKAVQVRVPRKKI